MFVATGACLLYAASVCFFQADKRRTQLDWLRFNRVGRALVWALGTVAATVSVLLITNEYGIEVGLPIWFALFAAFGSISLFVSALARHLHVASGAVALALATGMGALSAMMVGS